MESPASLRWIKASASAGLNACVELARNGNMIAMRDSKNPSVTLHFTQREMSEFIGGAKRGDLDRLVDR